MLHLRSLELVIFQAFFCIHFWLHGVFVLCWGFLSLQQAGATLGSFAQAPRCGGFSFRSAASSGLGGCGSRALEHRGSGCGARAQLLCGMGYPPGPGIKPGSLAVAGGLFTAESPGKSELINLIIRNVCPLTSISSFPPLPALVNHHCTPCVPEFRFLESM